MADGSKPLIVVTGAAGDVGEAVIRAHDGAYDIVGMDEAGKTASVPMIEIDLTDDSSVVHALATFRERHGSHIASVIHLAGYFDFTGKDNPLYHQLNVEGTRRLIEGLQLFDVEQFVYSGTMLAHEAVRPGEHLDETRRLDPQWAYPESKVAAEDVVRERHGWIPYVLLHLAGLYGERTVVPTLAHQIARIWNGDLESHVYAGRLDAGQSMVHKADVADAFRRTVDRRASLPAASTILIGEPDPMGYAALQDRLGELIHGEEWTTIRVPATVAAAGVWVEEKVLPHLPEAVGGGHEPFIRPFMAMEASDHYALDIGRARDLLGWSPDHRLADELPAIIDGLKRDPEGWSKANKIEPPLERR